MSEQGDLFDELEDNTTSAGFNSGDFADWWDPDEDDGEHLVGVVVEKHSAPEDWTDPGEVPDTIYTVLSVGRGDHEAGDIYTPRQHKQLKNGLEGVGVGDLVNIRFTGYEKVQGNVMNNYDVGALTGDEWEELEGADEVQAIVDDHKANDGIWGDNTRSEPYTAAAGPDASSGGSSGDDGLTEAQDHLKQVVDMQGGSVETGLADKMLNDVNDYGVDVEETAVLAGLEVEDGVISE